MRPLPDLSLGVPFGDQAATHLLVIRILIAAFDKAWEAVQASGVTYADGKIELARAVLAKHIIAAAKDGEFDQGRLRDGALLALRQSNLRSAPHSRR
jgi:hypothetical protein